MTCTGAACATCSNVAPGKLLRCSACHSAWYCNQDCQRKSFKEHKPFCKALRLFHALQADLPPESWPRTAHEFYVQRINCQQLLEPMLGRPLSRAEHRALLGEAKCSALTVIQALQHHYSPQQLAARSSLEVHVLGASAFEGTALGISESEQKLWAPALQLLVRHGVPVVFTSYNAHEAEGDAAAWRAAGGVVTLGPERNPYRALEPISEPSQQTSVIATAFGVVNAGCRYCCSAATVPAL
eukprot:XP_001695051.1 predicted protein [Chlamydomonas reinhardtii]